MLIKTIDYVANKGVVLVNLNIDDFPLIYAKGNQLKFSKDGTETNLTFASSEMAENARDRIFKAYGEKSPYSKYVDLTIEEIQDSKPEVREESTTE
jgi:hypothetical protein